MFTDSRIYKEGFGCRLFMESNSEKKLVFALMLTEVVNMLDIGVYRYGLLALLFLFYIQEIAEGENQWVTKRFRLSWLTNSDLVYEPKCRGAGGLRGQS